MRVSAPDSAALPVPLRGTGRVATDRDTGPAAGKTANCASGSGPWPGCSLPAPPPHDAGGAGSGQTWRRCHTFFSIPTPLSQSWGETTEAARLVDTAGAPG